MDMKKILLICNQSDTVINFRQDLIRFFLNNCFKVDVITSDSSRKEEIENLGVRNFVIPYKNRSKSISQFFKTKRNLTRIIKEISPDIVFTFQIKPNVLGVKAAKKCKVKNIYSMVEGLGDPFQPKNLRGRLIRFLVVHLYKSSFKHIDKAFFLNNEDKNEFIQRKIIKNELGIVIRGIGIDTINIKPHEHKNNKTVLMLCRLIKNKGIMEFCRVAELVKKERDDISFCLYGAEDEITAADLKPYTETNTITYYGFTKTPLEVMNNCSIYLSTSYYREGFPRTILEAMALEKPVVASNIIGSRDAVINGETGYLVDPNNFDEFKEKIIYLFDNPDVATSFGKKARQICEEKYDSNIINNIILNTIKEKL